MNNISNNNMIGDLTQQSDALNALSIAGSVALAIVALCAFVALVVLVVAKLFPLPTASKPPRQCWLCDLQDSIAETFTGTEIPKR